MGNLARTVEMFLEFHVAIQRIAGWLSGCKCRAYSCDRPIR